MPNFPTSLDSYPDTTGAEPLGSAGSGTGLSEILNSYGSAIEALQGKVGVDGSADTNSIDYKLNSITDFAPYTLSIFGGAAAGRVRLYEPPANGTNYINFSAPVSVTSDKTITLPDTAGTVALTSDIPTASELLASVGPLIFPVGAIYITGSATSPATTLGFGTWTQIEGKFIAGVSTSDTDFDLDDTGGAKTVTLTESEIPSHTHGSQGGTAQITFHGAGSATVLAGVTGTGGTTAGSRTSYRSGGSNIGGAASADAARVNWGHTHTSIGGDGAHENLPPYIAKYIWQRTA